MSSNNTSSVSVSKKQRQSHHAPLPQIGTRPKIKICNIMPILENTVKVWITQQ
jgi:hypothetical protein